MLNVSGEITCFSNKHAINKSNYPEKLAEMLSVKKSEEAIEEIHQWPNYKQTPLYLLENLAKDLNISSIFYKDESKRFGLKSFKALGGAYAVSKQLKKHLLKDYSIQASTADLLNGKYKDQVKNITVSCATDGNHGRSVAWGARMFGCPCVIYIHRDVSKVRELAISQFGANLIRISGNYDESVRLAAQEAKIYNRIIVSDTSYDDYLDIPKDVAMGYTVMLSETYEQLKGKIPTHIVIQGGVGGLASAVCGYFWDTWKEMCPRIIIVEPEKANCLQLSAKKGYPVIVEGDLDTLMAGLACGEVSINAWQTLSIGANDFLTVSEESIPATMKLLASGYKGDPIIEAGESAVPGLAALIVARQSANFSQKLGIDDRSRVLIFGTEGATDEQLYKKLIHL